MKVLNLALATLLSSFIVSEASANLVTNGSFETFNGTLFGSDGGAQLLTTSADLTGWTIVGGEIAILKNGNNYNLTTPNGNNFLDLTGYTDTGFPKGISQSLSGLVANQNYDLSLQLGVNNGPCVSGGINCTGPIQVSASVGATGQTFTYGSIAPGNQWGTFDLAFTATGPSMLLTIRGVTVPPGNFYIGLDNVSVNAVPLPAALWFLAAGLAGLALFVRRPKTSHLAHQRFA